MAHANLSRFYAQLGRIDDAEDELQLAGAAAARGRRKPIDRGDRARPEGEEAERIRREALLRRVLKVDPDDAVANFGLGEILLEAGSQAEAGAHLERVIASNPSHPAAYLALGIALEGVGRHAAAEEAWRRGVEIAARRGDIGIAEAIQIRLNAPDRRMPSGAPVG
ncbi:MAG: tetratricopeptide repeat protein [Thermoanaerobaculales bacterium]